MPTFRPNRFIDPIFYPNNARSIYPINSVWITMIFSLSDITSIVVTLNIEYSLHRVSIALFRTTIVDRIVKSNNT